MAETGDFQSQYEMTKGDFYKNLDFLNWYRYFYLIRNIVDTAPKKVLEVGAGEGIIKKCVRDFVEEYTVLDINSKLDPDFVGDVRKPIEALKGKYDLVIIADVLEHIPFEDFKTAITNLYDYLAPGGRVLVTIPHRRSNFLFMTPTYVPHVVTVPTGFLSPGSFYRRFIKRKIWIDPHHCWEIGDGHIKRKHVEKVFKEVGFSFEKPEKLIYVDYWILRK